MILFSKIFMLTSDGTHTTSDINSLGTTNEPVNVDSFRGVGKI